jgi:hypothetical protein
VKAGVPRELEAITMRLLARDPDGRYPTATDARAALFGAGANDGPATVDATVAEPVPARLPPPPPPGARTPGTRPLSMPAGGSAVRFADSERRWLVPTLLVVLVAVALGVAGLLIKGSSAGLFGGDEAPDETTPEQPADESVAIARTIDFDPVGDRAEHHDEAEAGNAIDGDGATAWSTESYVNPDWGGLKPGVGLVLELEQAGELKTLELETPSVGWQAEVYVADSPADELDGWGEPVATVDAGTEGTTTVDLGARGGAVLLWFTRAGDDSEVVVREVRLTR